MDEQKARAIDTLRAASSTCSSALTILSGSPSSIADAPALSVLRKDLISIFSLVYSQITKLALSLKPTNPAYSASVAPAEDLSKHINAVATCTTLFDPEVNGSTLVAQVRSTTKEIIQAVDLFLQTVITTLGSGSSTQGQGKDVYLIRTGAVHELIEQARGPDGIPESNVVAVKKRWAEDHRTLKDALQEFEDMMQPSMGDELEDEFGDGWDELGVHKEDLSLEELARVKAMHPLLRMISSLHKKVQLDLLSPTSSRSMPEYDILVTHSSTLISHLDDFVASLYSPQQVENVASSLQQLLNHLDTLKAVLQPFIPDESLEEAANKLSLDSKKSNKNITKWFATCFAQIQSLSSSARASIQIPQS